MLLKTRTAQATTQVPPSIASTLPAANDEAIGAIMDDKTKTIILAVIERAPQWLRNDLATKDPAARARAEEALAAMLVDAIGGRQAAAD